MSQTRIAQLLLPLLKGPLSWITRSKPLPADPVETLALDPDKVVCYVLRTQSATNLMMLAEQCEELGLPSPMESLGISGLNDSPRHVFLARSLGWFNRDSRLLRHENRLQSLLEAATLEGVDVQLVPVSVYWGRNPGKERSLFKLLFADQEGAGLLRRLLITLFNGRQVFVSFSAPISLKDWQAEQEPNKAFGKLVRILKLHFHRQRIATMGPSLTHRGDLLNSLLAAQPVRDAIEQEARKRKIGMRQAKQQAKAQILEIASTPSHVVLRLFDMLLTWLWNKLYDGVEVKNIELLRRAAQKYEIVYVPTHRSHMDYLLLSYVLYYNGLVPPHIAAGINLNFWPVGRLLRCGGAFFLRRSFKGNRLYTAVFNEYLHFLLARGVPVEYFIEGGRSRTGRLLDAKTGMLSMTVQNYLRGSRKPLAFIPVYFGYERVMEVSTYLNELHGSSKQSESFLQLLRTRKALRQPYGKVYVSFGEPLLINQLLDQVHPDWRNHPEDLDERPLWFKNTVNELAEGILSRINRAAAVSPMALVATILLAQPRLIIDRRELILLLDGVRQILTDAPYSLEMSLPDDKAEHLLQQAIRLGAVREMPHEYGAMIALLPEQAAMASYYRNNVLHLFLLPALMASCFLMDDCITLAVLHKRCRQFYPFLKAEFHLHWSLEQLDSAINDYVEALTRKGWLNAKAELIACIPETRPLLLQLARLVEPCLQRYAIALKLLKAHKGRLSRSQLIHECRLVAQKISLLYGINAPEAFDRSLFETLSAQLERQGYVVSDENILIEQEHCKALMAALSLLLPEEAMQRVLQSLP